MNQTLVRILHKTVVDNKKDWDVKLTVALWAYRFTYKVTTSTTPFALMYGIEAILFIELEIPSLRIANQERLDWSRSVKDKMEQLEALHEFRKMAIQNIEAIQCQRKVTFDKKIKKRALEPGMWVILQDVQKMEFSRKFDAVWIRPYIVVDVSTNNSIQLKTLDGSLFPTQTIGERSKEYKVWQ